MSTFTNISKKILPHTPFHTPSGRSSFSWVKSDDLKAYIEVGAAKTLLTIPAECFNELPGFLKGKDWVRIGATHGNPPAGSIDEFLQSITGGLSVASYVIPILDEFGIIEILKTRPMKVRFKNQETWRLWAYDPEWNDFRAYNTVEEWTNQITSEGAIKYLVNHVRKSVIDDFEPAYKAYIESGTGFFSMLRMLFPTIDFLGTLNKGHRGSQNAVAFIHDYLGRINERYTFIGDLVWYVFRHGLLHTQMPKVIQVGGTNIGWAITFNNNDHLNVVPQGKKPLNIYICPHQLYLDLINAIDHYIIDMSNEDKKDELLDNFKCGFIDMSRFYTTDEMEYLCKEGLLYLNEIISTHN